MSSWQMPSWQGWHRPLIAFTGAMAVLAVVSAVGVVVDDRMLVGSSIWMKPVKFSLSLVLYCLTLAWMTSLLTRGRRTAWWAGTVVVAAGVVEMAIIVGQVIRGKRSHFNQETALDAMLYDAMGTTIMVLWAATLVIAVTLWRSPLTDPAVTWAIRLGSVLALTGAGLGVLMTRPAPGQQPDVSDAVGAHSVGVPDGGPGMPLTGWSTTGGDLRIPHFVGMHALQLLPLVLFALAVLAPRRPRLGDPRVRLRIVLVASGTYAAVLALLTWQALRGQPLIRPDAVTLAAGAAILAGGTIGTLAALRTKPARPKTHDGPHDGTRDSQELVT